ncbi:hypothetical protein Harman_41830 [Haloarcula mannanilytica]|uniref:O-antigen ligase domain-containing protein n=1 Tax=Haloarcula mannanilytica TaxID=2509225 RepID=A0A4C2ENQ8_9EURY|nr:hypothetical protein [Haloarcula mannanilytica]GCF16248.1 hypothetical protein Harman_41830 [Haloarcula mannanilytica]
MVLVFFVVTSLAIALGLIFELIRSGSSKKLIYITLFSLPIDLFRLETGLFNISLPRFFLISVVTAHITSSLKRYNTGQGRIIHINENVLGIYICSISAILSLLISMAIASDPQKGIPQLFSGLSGIILILIIIRTASEKVYVTRYLHSIFLSYIFPIIFMLYTYYMYIVEREYIKNIPFRQLIPFELAGGGHLQPFQRDIGGIVIPRLTLPFTSPPHLSMYLVIGLFLGTWYLKNTRGKQRAIYSTYLLSIFFCLLLTASRTGILTLLIVLPIITSLYYREYNIYVLLITGIILSGPFLFFILNLESSLELIRNSTSSHIQARMIGVATWIQNMKTILFGIGLGNYPIYTGGFTPETNYIKFLAERGIIGTLLALPIYVYTLILLFRNTRIAKYQSDTYTMSATWFCIILSLLIGELFYDFIHLSQVWPIVGIATAVAIQYNPSQ